MPHLLPFIDSSGCLESIKLWEVSSPMPDSHVFFFNQGPNTATLKARKLILEIQIAILLSTSGKKQKFQNWPGQLEVSKILTVRSRNRENKTNCQAFPGIKIIIMEKSWKKNPRKPYHFCPCLEEVHLLHCGPTPKKRGVDMGRLVDGLIDCPLCGPGTRRGASQKHP